MKNWWRTDEDLMKNEWRTNEDLMKTWWRTDEELMKNWWRTDEQPMKNWWRTDEELVWSGLVWSAKDYHRLPQITTDYHRPPQTTTDYHRLPQTTTDYHRLPQTTSDYHRLPQTTTDCHWLIGSTPLNTQTYLRDGPSIHISLTPPTTRAPLAVLKISTAVLHLYRQYPVLDAQGKQIWRVQSPKIAQLR